MEKKLKLETSIKDGYLLFQLCNLFNWRYIPEGGPLYIIVLMVSYIMGNGLNYLLSINEVLAGEVI